MYLRGKLECIEYGGRTSVVRVQKEDIQDVDCCKGAGDQYRCDVYPVAPERLPSMGSNDDSSVFITR